MRDSRKLWGLCVRLWIAKLCKCGSMMKQERWLVVLCFAETRYSSLGEGDGLGVKCIRF